MHSTSAPAPHILAGCAAACSLGFLPPQFYHLPSPPSFSLGLDTPFFLSYLDALNLVSSNEQPHHSSSPGSPAQVSVMPTLGLCPNLSVPTVSSSGGAQ